MPPYLDWDTIVSSYRDMAEQLLKENPTIERRRRRKAVLILVVVVMAVTSFRIAWDHQIIASASVWIWNFTCRLAADWKWFITTAFR
jgi:hypothetical protein